MNKTVTINISGIIFHIEEDAYDKLSKYLATIKGYFTTADGGNEIMGDIEARIAEMLQGRTSAVKQVVLMTDVDFVIDNMGRPEDFAGEQAYEQTGDREQAAEAGRETIKRRLFRDPDSKVLGGVCAGIGNYFDFDATFLRIILALVTFFSFGSLIIVYIILWIAIPEAKTTAEKLAMKGEKVDINNISKAVKEETEQLKKRVEKYGKDVRDFAYDNRHIPRSGLDKVLAFLAEFLRAIGKVFRVLAGVIFIVVGVLLMFGLISSVFGFSMVIDNMDAREWVDICLMDGKDFVLGMIGSILFVGVPAVVLTYLGIKMLFGIRYSNRWISIGAGTAWTIGWIMMFYVGARTARDFSNTATLKQVIPVATYDTLRLALNEAKQNPEDYHVTVDVNREDRYNREIDYLLAHRGEGKCLLGPARLTIHRSQSDKVELVVIKTAKGVSRKAALERTKTIDYSVLQKDSLLLFDNYFMAVNIDKFRAQEARVILKLPKNKVVYLDKSIESILYDIENVSNTYNDEMVGRRWIMTDNGLKCLDCAGLDLDVDNTSDTEDEGPAKIRIHANGMNIRAGGSKLDIDSNGLKINGTNTHLRIDDKGIHVDAHRSSRQHE